LASTEGWRSKARGRGGTGGRRSPSAFASGGWRWRCEGAGSVRSHRDGDGDTWGLGRCHLPGRRRAGRSGISGMDSRGPGCRCGRTRTREAVQLRGRLCEQAPHGVHGTAGHNAELGGRKRSRAGFFNREQRVHQPGLSGRFSHAGCTGRSASASQGQAANPAQSSGSCRASGDGAAPPARGAKHYFLLAFFLRSAQ